jgi:pyruvate/2-oxoglutarate dehydrogenase complex dihydrolipoamide acyltransferase (E2) component
VSSSQPEAPVVVPKLDHPSRRVQLVQWLVDPGTAIHAGDRIAELLVAGVVFHLAAPVDGVLSRVAVRAHTPVRTGEILCWIDPAGAVA